MFWWKCNGTSNRVWGSRVLGILVGLLIIRNSSGIPADRAPSPVSSYRAGAFQHSPAGSYLDTPREIIDANLAIYRNASSEAGKDGVQILVFPEGGLGWVIAELNNTRDSMMPFCEELPSASASEVFCDSLNGSHPQLKNLSCMAREADLVLVVNLCTFQSCNESDPSCPTDGRYQWNTDLVFSSNGSLIAKYYKSHLWGGAAVFDQPKVPDPVSFVTPFGVEFGVFTCYDIDFLEPTETLISQGITNFVFPSAWFNTPPVLTAVQIQQAWSRFYSSNFVAANSGYYIGSGGGIFSAGTPINVLFNPDIQVSQLLVGDLPLELPASPSRSSKAHLIPPNTEPSASIPCAMESFPQQEGRCVYLHPGRSPSSSFLEAEHNGFTCALNYTIEWDPVEVAAKEVYALFVASGNYSFSYTLDGLQLQTCAFVRCYNPPNCSGTFENARSSVKFLQLDLQGAPFSAGVRVFPVVGVNSSQVVSTGTISLQTSGASSGMSYPSTALANAPRESAVLDFLFNFVLYGVGS